MPNHFSEHLLFLEDNAEDSDLAPIYGDLSQTEKLCEIKPPVLRQNKTLVVSLGLNKNWTDEQTRWGLKLVYSLVSSV